jgi:hypothetical protein
VFGASLPEAARRPNPRYEAWRCLADVYRRQAEGAVAADDAAVRGAQWRLCGAVAGRIATCVRGVRDKASPNVMGLARFGIDIGVFGDFLPDCV